MNIFIDTQVEKFIESLENQTVSKILKTIDLLETFGHELSMPHSKKVSSKLFELRIRGQQEVRIFYSFNKNSAFLLYGFVKKSQKIPQKELTIAKTKLNQLT